MLCEDARLGLYLELLQAGCEEDFLVDDFNLKRKGVICIEVNTKDCEDKCDKVVAMLDYVGNKCEDMGEKLIIDCISNEVQLIKASLKS